MADLASSNVTVTIERRGIEGKLRRNRVKITFGDGALTYPSGGVPLPGFASFGMKRNLDYLTVFDENDATGIIWKYDAANNKLRAYHILSQAAGVSGAGGTLTLTNGAVANSTGSNVGNVVNLAESLQVAIAAQTMYAEAVGW